MYVCITGNKLLACMDVSGFVVCRVPPTTLGVFQYTMVLEYVPRVLLRHDPNSEFANNLCSPSAGAGGRTTKPACRECFAP